jgi:hypothetical protein
MGVIFSGIFKSAKITLKIVGKIINTLIIKPLSIIINNLWKLIKVPLKLIADNIKHIMSFITKQTMNAL